MHGIDRSTRIPQLAALAVLALLAGCGSGTREAAEPPPGDPPPSDPPPGDPPVADTLPPPATLLEDGPAYVDEPVVETWEELRALAHAVFAARWIWIETEGEPTRWCFEPYADDPGAEGDVPTERICVMRT